MIPRIRPFFHKSYFNAITQFDWNIEREDYYKIVLNKIKRYYPKSKSLDFINYGRNSLFLILKILNIKKNDELLIPCFTCSTILDAIISNEIKPVLYEVNFDFTIDIAQLQNKITQRTKAIIVTHYWGIPSNIIEIKEITDSYGIYLIEDCAHSFCFKNNHITLGSIGDLSFTSFSNDKPLSLGNGSVLINNNNELSKNYYDLIAKIPLNEVENEKCSFLSLLFFYLMTDRAHYNQFIGGEDFYYYFITHKSKTDLIFNQMDKQDIEVKDFFRYAPNLNDKKSLCIIKRLINFGKKKYYKQFSKPMPKLMNSFSLNFLETAIDHIDELNSIRMNNGFIYNNYLLKNELFYNPNEYQKAPFLRYSIICKQSGLTRQVVERLNSKGYECGNFNWSMPLNRVLNISGKYQNSEFIAKNIINLPCYPGINQKDILKICDILNNFNSEQY